MDENQSSNSEDLRQENDLSEMTGSTRNDSNVSGEVTEATNTEEISQTGKTGEENNDTLTSHDNESEAQSQLSGEVKEKSHMSLEGESHISNPSGSSLSHAQESQIVEREQSVSNHSMEQHASQVSKDQTNKMDNESEMSKDIHELENIIDDINHEKSKLSDEENQISNLQTNELNTTKKMILSPEQTAQNPNQVQTNAISQTQNKNDMDSLSDVVDDFAKEAAFLASNDLPTSDDLSPGNTQLITPNMQSSQNMMSNMNGAANQDGVAMTASGVRGMKHGKFQPDQFASDATHDQDQDIPDSVIDHILEDALKRQHRAYVLDHNANASPNLLGLFGASGSTQKVPVIQSFGQGSPMKQVSKVATTAQTSINPIDQSLDHHQIQHTIYEDPLTGKQSHSFEGTSINIPNEAMEDISKHGKRGNPIDALVSGLMNMFHKSGKNANVPQSPVVINKHQFDSGVSQHPGVLNPINTVKGLFQFGRPNGSLNEFGDMSDDELKRMMNQLQEENHEKEMGIQEMNKKFGMDSVGNLLNQGQAKDLHHGDDLSEGDEILFHAPEHHDDSQASDEHQGDEVIHINNAFHPSNRVKDTEDHGDLNILPHLSANELIDENQVLQDHINEKTPIDLVRQKAVDDLLKDLMNSTDFSSMNSQATHYPLMGNMYTTSSLGIPSQTISSSSKANQSTVHKIDLTHIHDSSPNAFTGSNRLSEQEINQLGLGGSGKKFSDVDDLISHLQSGNEISIGGGDEDAADKYLMHVMNQENGKSDVDAKSQEEMDFFNMLRDDPDYKDINDHDQKIMQQALKMVSIGGHGGIGNASSSRQKVMMPSQRIKDSDNDQLIQMKVQKGGVVGVHSIPLNTGKSLNKVTNQKLHINLDGNGGSLDHLMGKEHEYHDQANEKNTGMGIGGNNKQNIHQSVFGETHFPKGHFKQRIKPYQIKHDTGSSHTHKRSRHHKHHTSTTTTTVDTSALTQILGQLQQVFGARRHHHHHRRHHRHHKHISHNVKNTTNIHINQGESSTVNKSKKKSSIVENSTSTTEKVRTKENKIVNIENVIHHIYRQPKRKQKINIKVTVKPMDGFKSSGPCEDNCEEEINKHIEEIMDIDNTKSSPSDNSQVSFASNIHENLVSDNHLDGNSQEIRSSMSSALNDNEQTSESSHASQTSHSSNVSHTSQESQLSGVMSTTLNEGDSQAADSLDGLNTDDDRKLKGNDGYENKDRELRDVDDDVYYRKVSHDDRRSAFREYMRSVSQLSHR
jgi:hypothetical protein